MNRVLLLGTGNRHKAEEISRLLSGLPLEFKTLSEFPEIGEVVEDGATLEENAILKARSYSQATGLLTVADDTGLEVEALNGEPGVRSARYAGESCSYEDNNKKLLDVLLQSKNGNRRATFRCVVAVCDERSGFLKCVEGILEGSILMSEKGKGGFGYDPLFYVPGLGKSLAELSLEEKNRVSHRALAVLKSREVLSQVCRAHPKKRNKR